MTEAWLSGPIEGVDPMLLPAAHSFVQARLDLAHAASGLSSEALWARPGGAASVAFHVRHTAGATDRLLSYARGASLSPEQVAAARAEADTTPLPAEALLALLEVSIDAALAQLRATSRDSLLDAREVGRAKLPSTVLGLIFHAAEHATRHAGQAITTAKLVKAE